MAAVSALIITRNRKEALGRVLDRLEPLPVDEVLVADNGSTDGTQDEVRRRGGKIRLLELGENLGTAGRNRAAEAASGELLLLLDDDSYPLPGTVERLVEAFAAKPRLGAAGGLVRDVDLEGKVLLERELGTFDWWLRAGRDGDFPDGLPAFFFPEGASMLRKEAFVEAGGFFEPYFIGSEGLDLAVRLTGLGWEVRYYPDAVFEHLKDPQRQGTDESLYYRIRNHLWFLWLRYPTSIALRRTAAYLTFDLVEATYRRAPGAWLRAVRDAWRLRDEVRGERRPLAREALRRAELNRGRMHLRLLVGQVVKRLPGGR